MTWAVTERELPGWNERPYFSCFPGTSTQWQPEEQYEYAQERYHTETFPPGAWACGVWAATFRDTRRLAGVSEGYDGTAAERDRIGERFYETVDNAIENSADPVEREYLQRIRDESEGPRDTAYQQGREFGEGIRETQETVTRAAGEAWAAAKPWLIGAAVVAGAVAIGYFVRAFK